MTEHISIDEMMEFLFEKKLDDSFLALSAKINAHLAKCDTCWEIYSKLVMAKELFNRIEEYTPRSERIAQNLLEGIIVFKRKQDMAVRISDCIDTIAKLKIAVKLKVSEMYDLVSEQLAGGNQYYNPTLAVAPKSAGLESQTDTGPKAIKSTIVDENQNRISIGLDRRLSAFFNEDVCPDNTLVALIPAESNMTPYFRYATTYEEGTVVVRFDDIEPGEYMIAFI